jgi:hypothetical protein
MTWERYIPTDEDRAFCEAFDGAQFTEYKRPVARRADEIEPHPEKTPEQDEAIRWILGQDVEGNGDPFDELCERVPALDGYTSFFTDALGWLCYLVCTRREKRAEHEVAVEIWRRETS